MALRFKYARCVKAFVKLILNLYFLSFFLLFWIINAMISCPHSILFCLRSDLVNWIAWEDVSGELYVSMSLALWFKRVIVVVLSCAWLQRAHETRQRATQVYAKRKAFMRLSSANPCCFPMSYTSCMIAGSCEVWLIFNFLSGAITSVCPSFSCSSR